MNSKDIIQILKSEPDKFTYAEIEQMMDEELEKDPSEMDTDFVDLCADVLIKALSEHKEKETNTKTENKKRIKIRIAKIIAIAAVVAVIMSMAVTVFAKYVKNDASDEMVKYHDDHFSVDLQNGEADADAEAYSNESTGLVKTLPESGFDHIILPTVLLGNEYTYDVNVTEDDAFLTALVTLNHKSNNSVITIAITEHKNGIDNTLINNIHFSAEYDSAKQITKNGMDILVFGNKEKSSIMYIDNDIDYSISLNTDFDSAIEIAESIK